MMNQISLDTKERRQACRNDHADAAFLSMKRRVSRITRVLADCSASSVAVDEAKQLVNSIRLGQNRLGDVATSGRFDAG
jgi:hypothetical protein